MYASFFPLTILVLTLPYIKEQRDVYVQSIYTDFFSRILKHRDDIMSLPSHSREGLAIAITGTPRTGKSYFLIYVAHMLQGENISFVITRGKKTYNSSYEEADITKDLDNSSVVHLIDPHFSGCDIDVHAAIPVIFASPTESNFKPYHLKEIYRYFMPLWTREELMDAHSQLGSTFEEDLFRCWGGVFIDIPRSELLHLNLTEVLQSKMLVKLVKVFDHWALSPKISHCQWLIHRVPCDDYRFCVCEAPSDFVRRKVLEVFESGIIESYPENSIMMGHIYERKVFHVLAQNPPNIVMKPSDKRFTTISNTRMEVLHVAQFTNSSVIQEPTIKTLYKPTEPNKKGLDAIYVLSKEVAFIIQATISKRHRPIDVSSVNSTMPNIITWNVCLFYGGKDSGSSYPKVVGLDVSDKNKYICTDIKLLSM